MDWQDFVVTLLMVLVGKLQVTAAVSSPPLVPIPDKLVAPPPQETPIKMMFSQPRVDPLTMTPIPDKLVAPPPQETPIKMVFSQPRVDPLTMTVSPSYSYGYSLSDKNVAQEVDPSGRSSGGYSWTMPGGGTTSFAFGSGRYVDGLNSLVNYGAGQEHLSSQDYRTLDSMNNYGTFNTNDVGHNSMINYGTLDSEDYGHNSMNKFGTFNTNDVDHNSMINYGAVGSEDIGHNSMMNYGTVDSNDVYPNSMINYDSNHDSLERYQASSQSQSSPWAPSSSSSGDQSMMDSSYVMRIQGPEAEWVERSDRGGERSGYYSYLTGAGDKVRLTYSAGRRGFRVLESEGVPGLFTRY